MRQNLRLPANTSDFPPVAVCFLDPEVTSIFADLLVARGVEVEILESICDFRGDKKIITEAIYFSLIDSHNQNKCLVVGNREALDKVTSHTLCQPLTEDKIESALLNFLAES